MRFLLATKFSMICFLGMMYMRKKLVSWLLKWVSNKCLCHLQSCQWSELCLEDTQVKITIAQHNGHKYFQELVRGPVVSPIS